jgi:hypothetical protein
VQCQGKIVPIVHRTREWLTRVEVLLKELSRDNLRPVLGDQSSIGIRECLVAVCSVPDFMNVNLNCSVPKPSGGLIWNVKKNGLNFLPKTGVHL